MFVVSFSESLEKDVDDAESGGVRKIDSCQTSIVAGQLYCYVKNFDGNDYCGDNLMK